MSLKNLSMGTDVEKPSTDNLGGGFKLKSGLYKMVIDVAYTSESTGGAQAINIHFKSADPSVRAQLRQTLWVVSKAGKNYFMGGKNKDKKIALPDMQTFDQICKICVPGTKPDELIEEKKTIKLWNYEMRSEVPTEVTTLPELKNKGIYVGVRYCVENKRAPKEPGSKVYVDTNERREFSEVHRVFHTDGFSTEEKEGKADKAAFIKTWQKKHTSDFEHDTFHEVGGSTTGASAVAAASAASADIDDDLFDD